jgi:hypothetical protein
MKKFISLLIILATISSLGIQASAAEPSNTTDTYDSSEYVGVLRNISKDVDVDALTSTWVIAFEDSNFWSSDDYVTVIYKASYGPSEIEVQIEYLGSDGTTWIYGNKDTLALQDSVSASIAGGATFRVWARKISGSNGKVTLHIDLN